MEPIADLPDDFIRGMDASAVLSLENSGVTYYNYEGKEQDVFETLAPVSYTHLDVYKRQIMMIAHGLNDDKIPCPSEYKRQNGCNYSNNRRLDKTYYWTYSTVKKILLNENENYIGNMVQHRVEKMAYNIKKFSQVEKSEWIRHEATHEPIIEQRAVSYTHLDVYKRQL